MEEREYSTEIVERHLKWLQADEGKIFWEWLTDMIDESMAGSAKYIGAWEQQDIIKANKMKAHQETYGWVSQYKGRLIDVLNDAKSHKDVLTSLEDL